MNVIFGSGIVGLLARMILGDSWTIIPFYKSRFFSFNPALDDNFIICDDKIDPFVKDLSNTIGLSKYLYTRAWSINGSIYKEWDKLLCNDWLSKIFGYRAPSQAEPYYSSRMNLTVYDLRVNELYEKLLQQYGDDLKREASKGLVESIGDHYFIRGGVRYDFNNAVSTIPLNVLLNLANISHNLESKPVYYFHIRTDHLDFEGFNQLLVVDNSFSFFKATNVAPGRYLIYAHEDIHNPGMYFMPFMRDFDLLDGTTIDGVLPLGDIPKVNLDKFGIFCVGSYAQWDWCMDVGSCILRIINYSGRGNKPGGKFKEISIS